MLKSIIFLSFSIFSFSSTSQSKVLNKIAVSNSSIILNDSFLIEPPFSIEHISSYLGQPRIDSGNPNSIVFWDSLGFMAFIPNDTACMIVLDICIDSSFYYETTNFFDGEILIFGTGLETDIILKDFADQFKQSEKQTYLRTIESGLFEVLFEFDEDTKYLTGIEIKPNKN